MPSCTVVTCEANELARSIHERMPVILADPEAWETWLDPAVHAGAARELLAPLLAEKMVVATREAIRLVRTQGRVTSLDEDHAATDPACQDRRVDLELTVEAREALERIGALTARQIRIFSLHLAGLTYQEISAATGHSRRSVERNVTRARARLRQTRPGLKGRKTAACSLYRP